MRSKNLRGLVGLFVLVISLSAIADGTSDTDLSQSVDFRYSPPEWLTAICLPDDSYKTIVDKSGKLLYHYHKGRNCLFGTRISVEVADDATWQKQELHSPRVPIVKTYRQAEGLEILEEAFAVTNLNERPETAVLSRKDDGRVFEIWAKPPKGTDPALKNIALKVGGSIRYEVAQSQCRIALGLCEGHLSERGKRVLVLQVEGAESRTVDTIGDIGKNKAAAYWFDAKDTDGNGKIDITVSAAANAGDKTPILNELWVFPAGTDGDDKKLLAGELNTQAMARASLINRKGPSRNDLLLVHVTNKGNQSRTIRPQLVVDTPLDFRYLESQNCGVVNGYEHVRPSLRITNHTIVTGMSPNSGERHVLELESLTIKKGQTVEFCVLYCGGGKIDSRPASAAVAVQARNDAVDYWENAALPYGCIQVPDPQIQGLIDSSIRNIWQAREIKDGTKAFQVGATCYRSLFIVDGAFLLEAATIIGAFDDARNGVEYELKFQKEDGRIQVLKKEYYKENGIVLWTCVRHARLTQDKAWLESVWPKLERVATFIKVLRKQTLENDSPADDGLIPKGFSDGGIRGVCYEYTNVYWNLVGMRSFIQGAKWLGKDAQAAEWQKEYDDFMAAFRKAAERDMKVTRDGNPYLPIMMNGQNLPQRAQWAFCHAVYPGEIFEKNDPIVQANLNMLKATEREGMVYGTGWIAEGVWNYFASFYGHAWLWEGDAKKATDALYAFANHAGPLLTWREEQSLLGEPYLKKGDMPHNWASAEFIRLAVHLLALDRDDELHLFEGMPSAWTKPGMVTQMNGIATPFGPLTMEFRIASDGKTARLRVEPVPGARKVVAHFDGWAGPNRSWQGDKAMDIEIQIVDAR